MFKAVYLNRSDKGTAVSIADLSPDELPPGNVKVRVEYSTLNYKDALAITGSGPVVRLWPMVPGIDLAGVVDASDDPRYVVGDRVLVNGWGLGETRWGGLAQQARVPADFLIPLPAGLTARQAMAIGTAGYTAMLCVQALEDKGLRPEDGEVLVTGANGGVGSFSIAILASKGYEVVASTGRTEEDDRLRALGARLVIDRKDFNAAGKPLQKERWAGAIDCVGGQSLANVCASTRYGGSVAACGLAGGMDLPATVAPFILRGITLLGVDSVYAPSHRRTRAWHALTECLEDATIESITEEIPLEDVIGAASDLIAGKIKGRVIVNPNY